MKYMLPFVVFVIAGMTLMTSGCISGLFSPKISEFPEPPAAIQNTSVKNTQTQPSLTVTIIPSTPISSLSPTQVVTTATSAKIGLTKRSYTYVLRGNSGTVNLNLDSNVYSEISTHTGPYACVRYNHDTSPCTNEELRQYYLNYLNESRQEKYLDALVEAIKSRTSDKDDRARIAISLVQRIPYDYERLGNTSYDMRFPYEVLYDDKGVCSEKSLVLAYLLRELGYGVALFEFSSQKHMAVGVKSSAKYDYLDSGYAFIETTSPTIPTYSQGDYVSVGKLTSTPAIYKISEGVTFISISEEYNDAQNFIQVTTLGKNSGGVLDQSNYNTWRSLVRKYGLKTGK